MSKRVDFSSKSYFNSSDSDKVISREDSMDQLRNFEEKGYTPKSTTIKTEFLEKFRSDMKEASRTIKKLRTENAKLKEALSESVEKCNDLYQQSIKYHKAFTQELERNKKLEESAIEYNYSKQQFKEYEGVISEKDRKIGDLQKKNEELVRNIEKLNLENDKFFSELLNANKSLEGELYLANPALHDAKSWQEIYIQFETLISEINDQNEFCSILKKNLGPFGLFKELIKAQKSDEIITKLIKFIREANKAGENNSNSLYSPIFTNSMHKSRASLCLNIHNCNESSYRLASEESGLNSKNQRNASTSIIGEDSSLQLSRFAKLNQEISDLVTNNTSHVSFLKSKGQDKALSFTKSLSSSTLPIKEPPHRIISQASLVNHKSNLSNHERKSLIQTKFK
ncbi:unnamed protein product [Blepharisma stoltei]|uniref:Uncharacterized protein n=1 Tax=Blepharisma stoltei TaxID=1481888 RepID=A0AAU9JRW7_9CILI|nr:unnamed protein product [Blepharisma stoltei]